MTTATIEINQNLRNQVSQFLGKEVVRAEWWTQVIWVHVQGMRPTFISQKKFTEFLITLSSQKTKLEDYFLSLAGTGSEKQIAWAEKIRVSALKYVRTALTNSLEKGKFSHVTKREINQIIVKVFNKYKTATDWIDGRYEMGSVLWDKIVFRINQLPVLKMDNLA
jgi:hypothetical protein